MIKNFYEILKNILPAIIAGLFTLFITRYTYNRKKPLDKLEISYNRVYYPIFRITMDAHIDYDIDKAIDKCKIYFLKYDKYIDLSTKRLFESLCKCTNETKKKSIYINFRDYIYNRNFYLRRKLGYLEPNIIQSYKYSMPNEKSFVRIFIELIILYISVIACGIFINVSDTLLTISVSILIIFLLCFICEIILCALRYLYYKIKK